ncbi:hypothetical protein P4O66_001847 [Electrophorus voltai]|uniref:Uncharacterized protein n=1 Tax=Electrophorus voltai TaxID=2609070 RepID=A0AAD8Z5U4_9TELE|nr:hypothetical protein P4O66_001847 [Electrophorus voltai]
MQAMKMAPMSTIEQYAIHSDKQLRTISEKKNKRGKRVRHIKQPSQCIKLSQDKEAEAVVEDEAVEEEEEEGAKSRMTAKEMTDATHVERKNTLQESVKHGRRGAKTRKQTDGQSWGRVNRSYR